jgi:hypothetical protein
VRNMIVGLLALLTLTGPPALAQVGSSYRTFRSSGFAKFFGVTTRSRKDLEDGGTVIHLEPGAHQKEIDIHLTIDRSMQTGSAQLSVARNWVGSADSPNAFARDIVKSFVSHVSCDAENEDLKEVIEQIWHYKGAGEEVVRTEDAAAEAKAASAGGPTPELQVFLGSSDTSSRTLSGCTLTFTNDKSGKKNWLRVRVEKSKGAK